MTFASAHRLAGVLREFGADVMHLASPFVLGWHGLAAAEPLGVPSVAVYQTDIPVVRRATASRAPRPPSARHLGRLHRRATLTLAPSTLGGRRSSSDARRRPAPPLAPRRRHRAVRPGPAQRARGGAAWRRPARSSSATSGGSRPRSRSRTSARSRTCRARGSSSSATGRRARARADAARCAASPASSGATRSPRRWRASTCSCTPARARRSARPIQEALASGVPVVATGAAARSTSCARASTAGSTGRATSPSSARGCATSSATTPSAGRSGSRARQSVRGRGWDALGDELIGHYEDVISGAPAWRARSVDGASSRRCGSATDAGCPARPGGALGDDR